MLFRSYEFCNKILKSLGEKLATILPADNIICRISNDGFASVFSYEKNIETLLKFVAKDLAVALSASFSSPKEEIDPMPQYNLRLLPVSEHIFAHIVLIFHKNVDSQTLRVLTYHLSQCIGNVFL